MLNYKYGVVYTPDSLASFVAGLLRKFSDIKSMDNALILDPSSGGCSLLKAAKKEFGHSNQYVGIDIDAEAANMSGSEFTIIHDDTIIPQEAREATEFYWKKKFSEVDAIIANPPWSSEKMYDKQKLSDAGFTFIEGQYDSYVLFMELGYKILRQGGTMAFIVPDSLFDSQNVRLRQFLIKNTKIKSIARLGEKIFSEVNRATTVIVCKKEVPDDSTITECFRLSTEDRKKFLSGTETLDVFYRNKVHFVKQSRFENNKSYNFDIDTHENEENLLKKISSKCIAWNNEFVFGRGVEISKSGNIVYCSCCSMGQGFSKKHWSSGRKKCIYCGKETLVDENTIDRIITEKKDDNSAAIYVGENIQRYGLQKKYYIKLNVKGINYKTAELYAPSKLLIRKTGLGIYGAVDNSGTYTSQTVYTIKKRDEKNNIPLEYYLALVNSRVVYYYYLKIYGENEWKSHPYLTKEIIFSLPIRAYTGSKIDKEIIDLSKALMSEYDRESDLQLEKLIMKKYGLNANDQRMISDEMNRLPNLSAVNNMKMKEN